MVMGSYKYFKVFSNEGKYLGESRDGLYVTTDEVGLEMKPGEYIKIRDIKEIKTKEEAT